MRGIEIYFNLDLRMMQVLLFRGEIPNYLHIYVFLADQESTPDLELSDAAFA